MCCEPPSDDPVSVVGRRDPSSGPGREGTGSDGEGDGDPVLREDPDVVVTEEVGPREYVGRHPRVRREAAEAPDAHVVAGVVGGAPEVVSGQVMEQGYSVVPKLESGPAVPVGESIPAVVIRRPIEVVGVLVLVVSGGPSGLGPAGKIAQTYRPPLPGPQVCDLVNVLVEWSRWSVLTAVPIMPSSPPSLRDPFIMLWMLVVLRMGCTLLL